VFHYFGDNQNLPAGRKPERVNEALILSRKIYVYSLSYLAKFFLESEMFHTKALEKIKKHIFYVQ